MKNLPKSSNTIPTYILNHVITHNYDNHDILLKLLVSQINVNYTNLMACNSFLIGAVSLYSHFKDNENSFLALSRICLRGTIPPMETFVATAIMLTPE